MDNSISFDIDLTFSTGGNVSAAGVFDPGANGFCLVAPFFGCPPGNLWDEEFLLGSDSGDLIYLDGSEINGTPILSVWFVDLDSNDTSVTGTISYSNIGWGDIDGQITGAGACGFTRFGFPGDCDALIGTPTFTSDSVSLVIDPDNVLPGPFLNFPDAMVGIISIGLLVEHADVPEPATAFLIGLGLAGLGFSRRKRAAYS